MKALALALMLLPPLARAEVLVAARTIRPHEIIAADDLTTRHIPAAGGLTHADQAVGQEARVALYAGRAIRPGDIGPPALIERNQIVPLVFDNGVLRISTEGRALERGGAGDRIRIMNIASRQTVTARVTESGSAAITP